jgi:hypothetical protein
MGRLWQTNLGNDSSESEDDIAIEESLRFTDPKESFLPISSRDTEKALHRETNSPYAIAHHG